MAYYGNSPGPLTTLMNTAIKAGGGILGEFVGQKMLQSRLEEMFGKQTSAGMLTDLLKGQTPEDLQKIIPIIQPKLEELGIMKGGWPAITSKPALTVPEGTTPPVGYSFNKESLIPGTGYTDVTKSQFITPVESLKGLVERKGVGMLKTLAPEKVQELVTSAAFPKDIAGNAAMLRALATAQGVNLKGQEIQAKYGPGGTEQRRTGAAETTAGAAATTAGVRQTESGYKYTPTGTGTEQQKVAAQVAAQKNLAEYHKGLINQSLQRLPIEQQKAASQLGMTLTMANLDPKKNASTINAAVEGLKRLGVPVIHPDLMNQFMDAYQKNPAAATQNAKRLGYYDAFKSMGLVPNE